MRAAQASLELAQQKMKRAEALVAQNFVSEQALEQARGELELATQKLNQVRSQQRIWVAGTPRRRTRSWRCARCAAPFDGVVVERYVNPGERVEDRPLLRVAVIDPLRVELMVPTAQYGSVGVGDKLTIRPELPGAAPVVATVRPCRPRARRGQQQLPRAPEAAQPRPCAARRAALQGRPAAQRRRAGRRAGAGGRTAARRRPRNAARSDPAQHAHAWRPGTPPIRARSRRGDGAAHPAFGRLSPLLLAYALG